MFTLAKHVLNCHSIHLQILMLNNNTTNEKLLRDERQGKMLLHTEFSLLSLLQNEKGVIQQHGMFSVSVHCPTLNLFGKCKVYSFCVFFLPFFQQDMAHEEVVADNGNNNNFYTGALRKRLILVLDCVTPHDFE